MKHSQSTARQIHADVLANHLNSFQENDLDGVMSDYTEESILITPEGEYRGLNEIESFFTEMVRHFPAGASRFEVSRTLIEDEISFIVWTADTPTLEVLMATDSFIFREGRIFRQTFAGHLNYKNNN